MELTPHVLMAGAGAERLARRAGIARCRPEDLITQRARERWRAALARRAEAAGSAAEVAVPEVSARSARSRSTPTADSPRRRRPEE